MNKKPRSQETKKPEGELYFFLLSAFCFLLFFLGCKQATNTNGNPAVQAQLLEGSAYLPANATDLFTYRIFVSDSRYYPDSIVCEVHRPDGTVVPPFGLFDDGGVFARSGPGYASPTSRDIAAHDGQYARQISGTLLADSVTGNYDFHFVFYGNADYRIGSDNHLTVSVQNAGPCLITSYPHDSVFAECFDPKALEVRVEPTAADHADSVQLTLYEDRVVLGTASLAPVSGDTIWSYALNPTFFECVASRQNVYTLEYSVHTQFGMSCLQRVNVVSFLNDTPSLSNPVMPDTIYRPMQYFVTDTTDVTVTLHDCELAGETHYYGVLFDVRREDVDTFSHINTFFLRDDGLAHDAVAGNGVFTVGLTFNRSDTLVDNLYYFRYYAIDCAPPYDSSAFVMDSVRVIQPGGNAIALNPGTRTELGIGAAQRSIPDARSWK